MLSSQRGLGSAWPCTIRAKAIPALLGMQARIPWPLWRLCIVFSSSTTFHSLPLQFLVPVVSSSIEIPRDFLCTAGKTARSRCSVRPLWFTPAPEEVKWEHQLPMLEQNYTTQLFSEIQRKQLFCRRTGTLSDMEIWRDIFDGWLPWEEEAKSVPAH